MVLDRSAIGSNRLTRTLIAVAEVLSAVALVGLAWWCWQRGVIVTVREGVALSRIEGAWWSAAIGSVTLAGILLLDAGRQMIVKAS